MNAEWEQIGREIKAFYRDVHTMKLDEIAEKSAELVRRARKCWKDYNDKCNEAVAGLREAGMGDVAERLEGMCELGASLVGAER